MNKYTLSTIVDFETNAEGIEADKIRNDYLTDKISSYEFFELASNYLKENHEDVYNNLQQYL